MSSTTLQDMNDIPGSSGSNEGKEDLKIVEFEGEGDKWDPKTFSGWKKWAILYAVTHGAVIVTCASSLYVRSLCDWVDVRLLVTPRLKRNFMFRKSLPF
jgi:hypothetical protein